MKSRSLLVLVAFVSQLQSVKLHAQTLAPTNPSTTAESMPATSVAVSSDSRFMEEMSSLINSVKGKFAPKPKADFYSAWDVLRKRVNELDQALAANSSSAQAWKEYLKRDKLEPFLAEEPKIDEPSLKGLREVLDQLRQNREGLELPYFTNLADAIERYKALAPWAEIELRDASNLRSAYDGVLEKLEQTLQKHATEPTTETAYQLNLRLAELEILGGAERIIEAIRRKFVHPNLWLHVSSRLISSVPTKPVNTPQSVEDCILGTTICGDAFTTGKVSLSPICSTSTIGLSVVLRGDICSQTVGYHKPVQINSQGTTNFEATNRVDISDTAFAAQKSCAVANTQTTIQSIQKTGSQSFHNIVERIAWKQAMKQKPQAEAIASQHAEQKVESQFDQELGAVLGTARQKYEDDIRKPLVRFGVFPDSVGFSSTCEEATIAAKFARSYQLAAPGLPPSYSNQDDLTAQIHETFATNVLMNIFLKGSLIKRVEGDATIQEIRKFLSNFDREIPITVQVLDGKHLQIRLRSTGAFLLGVAVPFDILATYAIDRDEAGITLKWQGDLDFIPDGIASAADEKLTDEEKAKVAVVRLVGKNLVSIKLPDFRIDTVDLPRVGKLKINEIKLEKGWVTIGLRKP